MPACGAVYHASFRYFKKEKDACKRRKKFHRYSCNIRIAAHVQGDMGRALYANLKQQLATEATEDGRIARKIYRSCLETGHTGFRFTVGRYSY